MSTQSFGQARAIFTMRSTSNVTVWKFLAKNDEGLIIMSSSSLCSFTHAQLFGLAPEQSPVYHHILWKWRNYKRNWYNARNRTDLNGLNSGVILLYLERIRKSSEYDRLFSPEWISNVVQKYLFKVSACRAQRPFFLSSLFNVLPSSFDCRFLFLRAIWVTKTGTLW